MHLEYLTLAAYFVLLIVIGSVFARFNRNLSDFVRGGARGTWWMVGTSMLMAGISAFTFTGNGSAVFAAGPSALIIYAANVTGFIIGGLFLARWLRQSRGFTSADLIRARFGRGAEQSIVLTGMVLNPLQAAVQLWALAVFVSAVFGLPVTFMIVLIGAIVLAYSTSGGMWGVMATDVVQGVILYGMTILLAVLCVMEVGGIGGFLTHFEALRAEGSFAFIKPSGAFAQDKYSAMWLVAIFLIQIVSQINLSAGNKYLAAKDGREASRASWFCMGLMALGAVVWFIPPMVARFLYADQVLASPLDDPATTAYAVAAANVLPNGLLGVMIAAMFSATMSSMDWGLNTTTGIIVNNFWLPLRRWRGKTELADAVQLRLCRTVTIVLGVVIMGLAVLLAKQTRIVLFDIFLVIGSVIAVPLTLPLVVGIFVKRLPGWHYFVMVAGGLIPSIWSLLDEKFNGVAWSVQERGLAVVFGALVALVLAWPLRSRRSERDRQREAAFWERAATPVDFEQEVGGKMDSAQARITGNLVLVTGGLLLAFLLVPNAWSGRVAIVALALFAMGCGQALRWAAARSDRS